MPKFEITWLEDRSDEAVLGEIRRVASLFPEQRLTRRMFNSRARIKSAAVERRFGSWGEATRRAGLFNALPLYEENSILEDLRRVSDLCRDEPYTMAAYSTKGRYSGSHIKRHFGGWRQALDKAGIGHRYTGPTVTERMREQPGRAMSNDELLDRIREVAAHLNKPALSGADIAANSEISQRQLYDRFGSVSAALIQAGVEVSPGRRKHSENEVFENLLDTWTHYGRPPTLSEMDRPPSTVGRDTYLHRYGTWRGALKAFVERANSGTGLDSALEAEPTPPRLAPRVSTEPPIASASAEGAPSRPKSRARPSRVARPLPATPRPEDRREPSIGLRFKVLQRDRFKCVLCGDHPARNGDCVLHVDHVIPWSKGGRTRQDNLRVLCATCNIGRGNRPDK